MTVVCSCGKKLRIPDALAGREIACPFCRAAVKAIASSSAPDDPAASLIQALKSRPAAAPPRNQPPPVAQAAPPAPTRGYYILGGVLAALLVAAMVFIFRSGEDEKSCEIKSFVELSPVTQVAAQPAPQAVALSNSGTTPGFFEDVPSGDSKDYEKRTGKKADSFK